MVGPFGVAGLVLLLVTTGLGTFVVLHSGVVAGYTPHAPIFIGGDSDFVAANGVTGGTGTSADPFVIEGWEIDASSSLGIFILHANASFVVRGVYVHSGGMFGYAVVLEDVRNGTVRDSVLDSSRNGLYVASSVGIAVLNNSMTSNEEGLRVEISWNVTIAANVISGPGMRLVGVRNGTIDANRIASAGSREHGILLDGTVGVVVTNNTLSDHHFAIRSFLDEDSVIANNRIDGSDSGIFLQESTRALITANEVRSSPGSAMQFLNGGPATIAENEFADGYYGLYLANDAAVTVYHNNFLNNTIHGFDGSMPPNVWDSGFPGGGNFWSGYNGSDDCTGVDQTTCPGPDGLGDVPYVIDPATVDRYPLTGPWSRLYGRSPAAPRMYPARLMGPGLQDVEITWDPSFDDGNGDDDVIGYEVRYGTAYDATGATYTILPAAPSGNWYIHGGAGAGDPSSYFYQVRAIEGSGRVGASSAQAGKESRSLTAGWHLLSLPFLQAEPSVGTMLQSVAFDVVRTYRASDAPDPWKVARASGGGDLTTVGFGDGLWVHVVSASDLVDAGLVVRAPAFPIIVGWNLVAYAAMNPEAIGSSLLQIAWTRVEGFDPLSSDPYGLRVLQTTDALRPGEAYWILASVAGLWSQG